MLIHSGREARNLLFVNSRLRKAEPAVAKVSGVSKQPPGQRFAILARLLSARRCGLHQAGRFWL